MGLKGDFRAILRGTGSDLPEEIISNKVISERYKIPEEEIFKKTGIRERRWAQASEASSDFATRAAMRALESAGIGADAIDLIILSSTTPDLIFPSSACLVSRNLKTRSIPAFDVQASCSGFIFALAIAENHLRQSGRHALVVSGEVKSKTLSPDDPGTGILFGDGGGAVVLEKSDAGDRGFLSFHLHSDGLHHDLISMPAGGSRRPLSQETLVSGLHYIHMKGTRVYRLAVEYFGQAVREALEGSAIPLSRIDRFIFHQANFRLIERVIAEYGIPVKKVENSLEMYGNTSSASIPITLDRLVRSGGVREGDLVLFASFGGGITWASALYQF